MPIAAARDEPGECCRVRRSRPGRSPRPGAPADVGSGPASSGAGSAPLRGCGTPPAPPQAVPRRSLGIPGSAEESQPCPPGRRGPPCPSAVHLPELRAGASLPAAAEKFGAPLRLPPSPFLPRDRCKHCPPRRGPATAATGACRLRGSLRAATGTRGPGPAPRRGRTFSALLGKSSASSPSLRSKVEPLFFTRPGLAGAAGSPAGLRRGLSGGGFFFPFGD